MDDRSTILAAINELIDRALALSDEIGDTYLGALLDAALHHVGESGATDGV